MARDKWPYQRTKPSNPDAGMEGKPSTVVQTQCENDCSWNVGEWIATEMQNDKVMGPGAKICAGESKNETGELEVLLGSRHR